MYCVFCNMVTLSMVCPGCGESIGIIGHRCLESEQEVHQIASDDFFPEDEVVLE